MSYRSRTPVHPLPTQASKQIVQILQIDIDSKSTVICSLPCGRRKKIPLETPLCFSQKQLSRCEGKDGCTVLQHFCSYSAMSILCPYFIYCTLYKSQVSDLRRKGWPRYSHFVFCTDLYKWGIQPILETTPFLAWFFSSTKITVSQQNVFVQFLSTKSYSQSWLRNKKVAFSKPKFTFKWLLQFYMRMERGRRSPRTEQCPSHEERGGRGLGPQPEEVMQSSRKLLTLPGHEWRISPPRNYFPIPSSHPFPTINY